MKRLAILLLTVFTIGAATVSGCGSQKSNSNYEDKVQMESIQIRKVEAEDNEAKPDCPDGECPGGECPDGECPKPRKSYKRHNKRLPRPKTAPRNDK